MKSSKHRQILFARRPKFTDTMLAKLEHVLRMHLLGKCHICTEQTDRVAISPMGLVIYECGPCKKCLAR